MRVVLVGADMEENLGIGMIAAALAGARHAVFVVGFDDSAELDSVVRKVLSHRPAVVGLGMQFQHRAHEFSVLARKLRSAGFRGHVTCGGQWPTMAWREALGSSTGIDSVVLHEGEQTIVDLVAAIAESTDLCAVAGIALRDGQGEPVCTPPRPLVKDLDTLPFPRRYRRHTQHVGVPFIPISSGRGCWGACSYCAITTSSRDAKARGALGPGFRQRGPQNVAVEMAALWHAAGREAAVFCFHDDNFLLPRPEDSLRRVAEMRRHLDEFGVGKAAFVGKVRPDCVTAELARQLAKLGVVRLYVGVENASQRSADHLNRKTQTAAVEQALLALQDAGIFACYNLLIFEPDATLDDVRQNIEFIRKHAEHPVNFCRVEPYHGTPLQQSLASRGILSGSHFGWDYRIVDDRTELMYRICAAAFRERNFAAWGVANRYMGLGYSAKLAEHFYPDQPQVGALVRRARVLTESIALENAELLGRALRIAETVDLGDEDTILKKTALLGLEIAALDSVRHAQIDAIYDDMRRLAKTGGAHRLGGGPTRLLAQALQGVAMLSAFTVTTVGCGGSTEDSRQADAALDVKEDPTVYDALPPDAGKDVSEDPTVYDALPPDAGADASEDSTVVDMAPPDGGLDASDGGSAKNDVPAADHWRDTAPRRAQRTDDLPLYDPPSFTLTAKRSGDRVLVRIDGGPENVTTRWEASGPVIGVGREVEWLPDSEDDQIRLAVRARGGIAVVSLRVSEVVS
jgi:radical SAM superfamily enzyme YgiQ (UPF0313 family)